MLFLDSIKYHFTDNAAATFLAILASELNLGPYEIAIMSSNLCSQSLASTNLESKPPLKGTII